MTFESTLQYLFDTETFLGEICIGVVFFLVAFLLGRLAHLWTRRVMHHPGLLINKTDYKFVGQLIQAGLYLFAATMYAEMIPAFESLGNTLLAGASIFSIVLGLAAQTTLGNFIAGIAILIYKPFNAGHVLSIVTETGSETGTVKEFNFGYTTLVTDDGRTILAPNSIVITSILVRGS